MFRKNRINLGALMTFVLLNFFMQGNVSWGQDEATLTINYIETEPIPEESAYMVRAYVTVSDVNGIPVGGIEKTDFFALEDAKDVDIAEVASSVSGMSILLLLDTSGSMQHERKWEAASAAADKFIMALAPEDRIALITFNEEVVFVQDFTSDHNAARNAIYEKKAVDGRGTCLYDAVFEAVKKMAEVQKGNRAIILLTDGFDETIPGEICSIMTFDDVVREATTESTRVPIYTIGLGQRVNAQELGRLAELTGGQRLLAPSAEELMGLFDTVAAQLKNQYVITYKSNSASGEHLLSITAEYGGRRLQDAKTFFAPSLEPTVSFTSPESGQRFSDIVHIVPQVTAQGKVAAVKFYANGELVCEAFSPPWGCDWDVSNMAPGEYMLRAEVYDTEGKTSIQEINLTIEPKLVPTSVPIPTSVPTPPSPASPFGESMVTVVCLGVLILAGVVGVIVVVIILFRKRGRRAAEESYNELLDFQEPWPEDDDEEGKTIDDLDEVTHDDLSASVPTSPATLTVKKSVKLNIGQQFELFPHGITNIGRSKENHIVIPDSPVSREHGRITFDHSSNEFSYYDNTSTYGSWVNGETVGRDGKVLQDGDEIGLGKRTVLVFQLSKKDDDSVNKDQAAEETEDDGIGSTEEGPDANPA